MLQGIFTAAIAVALLTVSAVAEEDEAATLEPEPATVQATDQKPAIRKVDIPADAKPVAKKDVIGKDKDGKAVVVAAAQPGAVPPVRDGAVIFHDATSKLCIGGVNCPTYCAEAARSCTAKMSYVVTLDQPSYIAGIQLNAHDNIGASRRSKLIVKVNGKELDSKPVFRLGSSVSLKAGAVGQVITIESAHQHNGFLRGGEEALIWDVYVFGSKNVQ